MGEKALVETLENRCARYLFFLAAVRPTPFTKEVVANLTMPNYSATAVSDGARLNLDKGGS